MLRNLYNPEESELLKLCKSGSWESVSSRTRTHPSEAQVTDAARQGHGTTALSIAIRSNASLLLVQEILQADTSQIAVTHSFRGTILHEAFRYRVNDDILEYLIHEAIRFENGKKSASSDLSTSKVTNLFDKKDELGRTPLHYMVGKTIQSFGVVAPADHRLILQEILDQNPKAASTMDADGNTPIIMLLVVPRFGHDSIGRGCEKEIFSIIKLMLESCPEAVKAVRHLPRPWHFRTNHFTVVENDLLHGEGLPTPLSCALLHHRSLRTVQLLISVSREMGINACTTIVTHHQEAALHVAATMNSSHDIIQSLVEESPAMACVPDAKGLLPMDWIWIRHVIEWCSFTAAAHSDVNASRRRYVSSNFSKWHEQVSNQYLLVDESLEKTSPCSAVRESIRCLRIDFIQRITKVLSAMAKSPNEVSRNGSMTDEDTVTKRGYSSLPLVHLACAVNCPLALVALLCESYPEQLRTRETVSGRLPLHMAVSRSGYLRQIPVGAMGSLGETWLKEDSSTHWILSRHPTACRIADSRNQLPLHISIDLVKSEKNAPPEHHQRVYTQGHRNIIWTKEVVALLEQYPEG
ncbi:ankyrin repeat domain protein [Nitzschia inconspicua]|uniref:Ankyrin repeat domain protein n=1 Tax=Nitzschia inconspicua TaxID=303405 RepID=A0A9K3LWT5_9STRA|nr:ankyrin repeat domain protein [Nitzschia inconspicua]